MSEHHPAAISAIADDPKAVFLATVARELHQAGVATDTLEETLGDIASSIGLTTQIFALPTQITIAVLIISIVLYVAALLTAPIWVCVLSLVACVIAIIGLLMSIPL